VYTPFRHLTDLRGEGQLACEKRFEKKQPPAKKSSSRRGWVKKLKPQLKRGGVGKFSGRAPRKETRFGRSESWCKKKTSYSVGGDLNSYRMPFSHHPLEGREANGAMKRDEGMHLPEQGERTKGQSKKLAGEK